MIIRMHPLRRDKTLQQEFEEVPILQRVATLSVSAIPQIVNINVLVKLDLLIDMEIQTKASN